jgi:hypothetical protein
VGGAAMNAETRARLLADLRLAQLPVVVKGCTTAERSAVVQRALGLSQATAASAALAATIGRLESAREVAFEDVSLALETMARGLRICDVSDAVVRELDVIEDATAEQARALRRAVGRARVADAALTAVVDGWLRVESLLPVARNAYLETLSDYTLVRGVVLFKADLLRPLPGEGLDAIEAHLKTRGWSVVKIGKEQA